MIKAYLFTFWVFVISPEGEPLDVKAHFSFPTEEGCRKVEFLTTNTHEAGQCEQEYTINTDNNAQNNKRKILAEMGS